MRKCWMIAAAVVPSTLASLVAGSGASAGVFEELEGGVSSIFEDGWSDWEVIDDPSVIFDPESNPSAVLIAVPSPEFVDIVDFGCVDMQPLEGNEFNFSVVIDANACIGIGGSAALSAAIDSELVPLAGFIWAAIDENGQGILFECLEARGVSATSGAIDAELEFFDYLSVLGSSARSLPDLNDLGGTLSSMMRSGSRRRIERKSLFETVLVGFILGADPNADLDDDTPDNDDGVWTLNISFSACTGIDQFPEIDIDHYRRRAESETLLPDTL